MKLSHFILFILLLFSCKEEEFQPSITEEGTEMNSSQKEPADGFFCSLNIERYPVYKHGNDSLVNLLSQRLPGFKSCIEGKVFIGFTVQASGEVTDIEMMKGFGSPYDEEILKAVKPIPDLVPGTLLGDPVKFRMIIPLFYRY